MSKYIVYLEPAEDGGYTVTCPHLPGCITQGETIEEALALIKDAIKGYISSLEEYGDAIPSGLGDNVAKIEVVQV